MSQNDDKKNWTDRLMRACNYHAATRTEEQDYFRNAANSAPLKELELFLAMPPGKFHQPARAVMEQVYRERCQRLQKEEEIKKGRADWWRGLLQQVSAQLIGTLLIGLIIGFLTGVWFSC